MKSVTGTTVGLYTVIVLVIESVPKHPNVTNFTENVPVDVKVSGRFKEAPLLLPSTDQMERMSNVPPYLHLNR